jgi:hypothetical protein
VKAVFKPEGLCALHASFDDEWGHRMEYTYSIPRDGGYVRDERGQQVCEGLAYRGATLVAYPGWGHNNLAAVIRRNYRAMRAYERREAAR